MKRASIIILFLLGMIILLTLLYMNDKDSNPNNNMKNDSTAVEEHTSTEQSNYRGIHIVTDIHDEALYKLAIHYPEFDNTSLNEAIREYITVSKQQFLEEVELNKPFLKENIAELNLSFDIYPVINNIYSIVLSNNSYVSGANGSQSSKVLIVDVDEGRYISQLEIIKDTIENRATIYKILSKEFEQSEEYSIFFFQDYLKQWIDDNHPFSNLYLNNHSLVFKFDKYQVTAGAAGSPEISIPIDKVKTLFTDEWIEKLKINIDNMPEKPIVPSPTPSEGKEPATEVPSNKKRVALTFDDGPHPVNTVSILKLLEKYEAKATFFMLGNRVDFYPETAKKVADQGHEIGNHTWDHKDLTTLDHEEMIEEINRTITVIKQAIGQEPTAFRPPYGAMNDKVKAASTDLPIVLWSIDTLDWKSHDPEAVLKIVKSNVKDGSIILMHDIHKTTVEAVALVLKYLQDEGYEFVTVSDLKSS